MDHQFANDLPDVALRTRSQLNGTLDRVGMKDIEVPVLWPVANGSALFIPAKLDVSVSLDDPSARGIHMSRLYLELMRALENQQLNFELLSRLLKTCIVSQGGLSQSAFIKAKFSLPLKRKALLSEEWGWRYYPIEIESENVKGEEKHVLKFVVLYSSTCPCSGALAQQALVDQFSEDFPKTSTVPRSSVLEWLGSEEAQVATPHAQRSIATVTLQLKDAHNLEDLQSWLNNVEATLGTPVQAAVKRQDEQEFARLNAHNMMFCEDACRRIQKLVSENPTVLDYYIHVEHVESLHPHSAISVARKGVPEGL